MSLIDTLVLNPALATFLAIHRTGSISATADALHLSQPAVTRRLQALERQLGAALFDRNHLGLRLNSMGEALLPHAERAAAAERDGLQAITELLAEDGGRVTIGVVGSLAGRWLSDVITGLVSTQPNLDLVIATATSRQIRDQVRRGELDLGISYARPVDPELEFRTLFDERLVIVASPTHRAAGQRVTVRQLRHERWLLFPESPPHPESSGTIARHLLERHQIADDRIRPIDSLSAQRALARAGYGLAFLPESAVEDDVAAGDLAILDVPDARITSPVTLTTRRDAFHSRAVHTLIERLTNT